MISTFSSSSVLKIEAVRSSYTMISTEKFTRRYNPEDHQHLRRREHLKSNTYIAYRILVRKFLRMQLAYGQDL
jgi:hypothetical protein